MRTDFGGGALRSQLLGRAARTTVKPVIHAWSIAPWLPWPYFLADHAGRAMRKAPGTSYEPVRLDGCRAEIVRTPESDPHRFVVYFHGGAFVVGGRHLHRALLSRIARKTRATVLAVEYRKLPRNPVSRSVADCLQGYAWVLGRGVAPEDVVFMGDSAGGYLTFMTAEAAHDAGMPAPAGIVALSPLLDFDFARTPTDPRGCDLFNGRCMAQFATLAARKEGRALPRSPMDVEPRALPPVLIQCSSSESLFPQAVAMYERLLAAGAPVELQVWDGQLHVFHAAGAILPEARDAVREIGRFVESLSARSSVRVA